MLSSFGLSQARSAPAISQLSTRYQYPILTAPLFPHSAVRFCGGTFSYTAISVLLNYSAPISPSSARRH